MKMRAASPARRLVQNRRTQAMFLQAFSDKVMFDHASLVVFTRGQMNGLRAAIRRLKLA